MIKYCTIALILVVSIEGLHGQVPADKLIADALRLAKTENKNVFVKFSASWCYWCKKLDSYIKSGLCNDFFDSNYVVVTLVANEMKVEGDFDNTHLENPGANELLIKNGCEKAGLPMKNFPMPFWYIIDEDGKLLDDAFDINGESLSCPTDSSSVEKFIQILSRTSNMTEVDVAAIRKTFISE